MRILAQVFVAQADKLSPSVVLAVVDSNRMVSMRLLGSSLVFSVALVAADVSPGLRGAATEGSDVDGPVGDTFPDLSTGFDIAGPYLEEPSEEEAESPKPSVEGWENSTSLRPEASNTWGNSFCETHHTGYFCDRFTRVRCCRQAWGFVKCGTTVHSSQCGWRGPGGGSFPAGRQSSFCRSHHVGFFCASHHRVHCCNNNRYFYDCTTRTESSWRC